MCHILWACKFCLSLLFFLLHANILICSPKWEWKWKLQQFVRRIAPEFIHFCMLYFFFGTNVCRRKEKNGTKKTFTQMYMSISIRKKMMMMVKKNVFLNFSGWEYQKNIAAVVSRRWLLILFCLSSISHIWWSYGGAIKKIGREKMIKLH